MAKVEEDLCTWGPMAARQSCAKSQLPFLRIGSQCLHKGVSKKGEKREDTC